jgi:hypothetical protein
MVRAEISFGREHYSSPLVRFANEGPLIRIEGRNILAGNYHRVAASGSQGFSLGNNLSLQLNGAFEDKNFLVAKDLNFRLYNLDSQFRWQLQDNNSLGFGPGVQRIEVAGKPFRQRHSLQTDWTHIDPDRGYTTLVIDYGRNRHAEEFKDLDSTSGLALVRHQFLKPVSFLNEIAVEAGIGKESNLNHLDDLSSRQQYARISSEWGTGPLKLAGGLMIQKARFKAASLDELPVRQDVFSSIDLSCEYTLSKDVFLRADTSRGNNRANSALFESRFNTHSLSLAINF